MIRLAMHISLHQLAGTTGCRGREKKREKKEKQRKRTPHRVIRSPSHSVTPVLKEAPKTRSPLSLELVEDEEESPASGGPGAGRGAASAARGEAPWAPRGQGCACRGSKQLPRLSESGLDRMIQ